jgi:hypothetical protein
MIFHFFSGWSCALMIMFTGRLRSRFGGTRNIWWLFRCSSLLLVTCMKCLAVLTVYQTANRFFIVGRDVTERDLYGWSWVVVKDHEIRHPRCVL